MDKRSLDEKRYYTAHKDKEAQSPNGTNMKLALSKKT